MERRVVITGMGIWSCIGTTLDEVCQSLFEGRSGIVFSHFWFWLTAIVVYLIMVVAGQLTFHSPW